MFKLGWHSNNEAQEYHYSDLFNVEQKSSCKRIIIGLAQGHIDTILDLNQGHPTPP